MGDGLKRVAKQCGGLTVTAQGKTARYNANGERLPFDCKCTFAQRIVGDGCDICNPKLAEELSKDDDA